VVLFYCPIKFQQVQVVDNPGEGQTSLYSTKQGELTVRDSSGKERKILFANFQRPNRWHVYGHSYWDGTSGAVDVSGGPDVMFANALGLDPHGIVNQAVSGSRLTIEGRQQGGFARVLATRDPNMGRAAPYVGNDGGAIFGWGINDLGFGSRDANHRAMYAHTLRALISFWRASVVYDDATFIGTRTTYSSGWNQVPWSEEWTIGGTTHDATTAGPTITLTLPDDYDGETVAVCFHANFIGYGGTVTFGGTTGVSGSLYTGAQTDLSHGIMVHRFTGLTSADAGKTITVTVTSVDTSGMVSFCGWWLESKTPPPVIVANIAKLPNAGYSKYPGWSGTEQQRDSQVDQFNQVIRDVVAEFDQMVQVADIDAALNKDPKLFWDNLHPNEAGNAKIADALLDALARMTPPATASSATACFNPPTPRHVPLIRVRRPDTWYTVDFGSKSTPSTLVANELWAIPFVVSSTRERYNSAGIAVNAAGETTGQVKIGIYSDPRWSGYPQGLVANAASQLNVSTGLSTGLATLGPDVFNIALDPGLYWLAVLVQTPGEDVQYEMISGPVSFLPNMDSQTGSAKSYIGFKVAWTQSEFPTWFPENAQLVESAPLIALKTF